MQLNSTIYRNLGNTDKPGYRETRYTYTANLQPYKVARADGSTEKYTYDSMGRVTRVDYYAAGENTDVPSPRNYTLYEYDANGRVTREEAWIKYTAGGSDHLSTVKTEYTYDLKGRLVVYGQNDGMGDGNQTVSYTYDEADRVTSVSYIKNNERRVLGYEYDGYGRISKVTVKLGEGPVQTAREYVYDANGDLLQTKDYRNFTTDAESYIRTVYTFNSAGMLKGKKYIDKPRGGTEVMKENYEIWYDGRGYIKQEKLLFKYGAEQNITKKNYYDDIGRLTLANVNNDGIVRSTTYTYDKVGNRLSMQTVMAPIAQQFHMKMKYLFCKPIWCIAFV